MKTELTYGECLWLYRLREGGLKQQEMALRCGIKREDYSKIERDDMRPTETQLFRITDESCGAVTKECLNGAKYDVTPGELLGLLLRHDGITAFCGAWGINPSRITRMVRQGLKPSAKEQTAIYRQFPILKGAWK